MWSNMIEHILLYDVLETEAFLLPKGQLDPVSSFYKLCALLTQKQDKLDEVYVCSDQQF